MLFCIRMGLALMAFGFFVARLALFMQAVAGPQASHWHRTTPSNAWGVTIIEGGVLLILGAAWFTWRYLRRLPPGGSELPPTLHLALVLSILVALFGVLLGVTLLVAEV
jgi:uncharacterized membrane protein YidH (DUF202 family)